MRYTIREEEAFSVVGQKVELTNYQRKNVQVSTRFWRTFNENLKKAYLAQGGNWTKYAFMEKTDGKLFYYCAIPKKAVTPEGFSVKEIKACKYLVVEYVGSMNEIYNSYSELYQEVLPSTGYIPLQDDFLHFEKYDYRFHWNRENSIIEIWLPIRN